MVFYVHVPFEKCHPGD